VAKSYAVPRGLPDMEHEARQLGVDIDRDGLLEINRQARSDRTPLEAAKYVQYANSALRGTPVETIAELITKRRNFDKTNLYKVNLSPDEHQLLDWDKPLSEQSEAVRKQLLGDLSADDLAAKVQAEGRQPTSLERLQMNYRLRQERGGFDPSGQAIYHDMRDRMGDPSTRAKTDKSASAALREAGIPGIKYTDQLSRGRSLPDLMAGRTDRIDAIADIRKRPPSERNSALIAEKQRHIAEYDKLIADYKPQTSNYVMFDAEDIEILDQGLLGPDPRK
jgi:hypothetical protein